MRQYGAIGIDEAQILPLILGFAVINTAGIQLDQHREIGQVFCLSEIVETECLSRAPTTKIPAVVAGKHTVFINTEAIILGQRRIIDRRDIDLNGIGIFLNTTGSGIAEVISEDRQRVCSHSVGILVARV